MAEYLITALPPGPTGHKIVQFFNRIEHPFQVPSKVDELAGCMHVLEDSTAVGSNPGLPVETTINKFAHVKHLASGSDSGLLLIGNEPFFAEVASLSAVNESVIAGGSAVNFNLSILGQEPRRPNVVMEATSGSSKIANFSGNPAMVSIMNEKEYKEEANPLSQQRMQIQLFPVGQEVKASMTENDDRKGREIIGNAEGLVNNNEFNNSEDCHEKVGEEEEVETQMAVLVDPQASVRPTRGDYRACPICKGVFSLTIFGLHLHTHPLCTICEMRFPTREAITEHNRMHFACEQCGKAFATKHALERHKVSFGRRKRFHECTECREKFISFGSLFTHYRRFHGVSKTPRGSPRQ